MVLSFSGAVKVSKNYVEMVALNFRSADVKPDSR